MSRIFPAAVLTIVLLWVGAIGCSDSGDSPILSLDDVIGIEIQRASLGERAMEEGKQEGLVIEAAQKSNFRLVRRFDPEYVNYASIQIRKAKKGWATAMTVVPRGQKAPPGVFVLDEECRYLQLPRNIPEEADIDVFEGRAYSRMPLGSHLIGSGYAVAFPTPRTMRAEKAPMATVDWINLVEQFQKKARIDPDSLFLVATHEHAELAMRVASNVRFAGVVIEAPRELMFVELAAKREEALKKKEKPSGRKSKSAQESSSEEDSLVETGPTDVEEKERFFHSNSHFSYYFSYARSLKEPALIILAKEDPQYERTRKTLLSSLVIAEANFRVALLDRWARVPMTPEEKVEDRKRIREEEAEFEERPVGRDAPPRSGIGQRTFRYEEDQFERWIARMGDFLFEHTKAEPLYLPLPDPNARRRGGGNGLFGSFEGFSEPAESEPVDGGDGDGGE